MAAECKSHLKLALKPLIIPQGHIIHTLKCKEISVESERRPVKSKCQLMCCQNTLQIIVFIFKRKMLNYDVQATVGIAQMAGLSSYVTAND